MCCVLRLQYRSKDGTGGLGESLDAILVLPRSSNQILEFDQGPSALLGRPLALRRSEAVTLTLPALLTCGNSGCRPCPSFPLGHQPVRSRSIGCREGFVPYQRHACHRVQGTRRSGRGDSDGHLARRHILEVCLVDPITLVPHQPAVNLCTFLVEQVRAQRQRRIT